MLDLVVGAPYTGAETLQYGGAVLVHLGTRAGGGYTLEPAASRCPAHTLVYLMLPGTRLSCTEAPCSLGTSLEASGDTLVVGAPFAGAGGRQRGAVLVREL